MGSVDFAGKQPTEKEYNIKARVKKLRQGFIDSRGRKLEADMVLLIPRMEDTECIRFMMAWQPLDVEESPGVPQHFELSAYITTPGLHTATRLAILPPGPLCQEQPYLTVMSVGPKTRLESKDGQMIDVKIMPEGEDEVADEAIPE